MPSSRTYVVGLPVILTVNQGTKTVTVSVDLSEAGSAIADESDQGHEQLPDGSTATVTLFTPDEQDQDVALVEELYEAKAPTSFTMEWQ